GGSGGAAQPGSDGWRPGWAAGVVHRCRRGGAERGGQPVTPQASDFRLLDDRGRVFAVDPEATRSTNAFGHRRNLFDASVPPGSQVATFLAFETTPDANVTSLRVAMGYGELELPRAQ